MEPLKNGQLTTEGANALSLARAKGIRFWLDNGQLRYSGPRNALNHEEISRLRDLRDQIIALLEIADETATAGIDFASSPRLKRAPLTFSQLAHWNLRELGSRRSRRDTAVVLLLRGSLSVTALQQSLIEIVRRHEALRTRIVKVDSVPMQEVGSSIDCSFEVVQLEPLPRPSVESQLQHLIEGFVQERIDVSCDPLFSTKLIGITSSEHV